MFCSECGKQVADNAKFCGECGATQFIKTDEQSFSKTTVENDHTFKSVLRAVAVIIGVIWVFGLIVYSVNLADNQQFLSFLSEKDKHNLFRSVAFQFLIATSLIYHFSMSTSVASVGWKGWTAGRRVYAIVQITISIYVFAKFLL